MGLHFIECYNHATLSMLLRKRNEPIRIKEFYTIEFWIKLVTRIPVITTQSVVLSLGYRCSDEYLGYTNF